MKPNLKLSSPKISRSPTNKFKQNPLAQSSANISVKSIQSSRGLGDMHNNSTKNQVSMSSATFRPKAVMCHICGREFGTASIGIHLKQCEKLWEEREMKKSPKERKPVPIAPKDLPLGSSRNELDEHNKLVYESYNENVMVQCPNCLRTFLEDRLQIHLKSCTSDNPHKLASGASKLLQTQTPGKVSKSQEPTKPNNITLSPLPKEKPILRPKALMCHICGREFGTASIEIHIKNCTKLWEERESKKPKNERRPVPSAPTDVPISKTHRNIEEHNNIVSENFTNKVMTRCPNCFRTFLEERIEIHLKSCTSDNPHKIAPSVAKAAGGEENIKTYIPKIEQNIYKGQEKEPFYEKNIVKPKTLMCHICGKEYGTASYEIHLKNCAKIWEERESRKPPRERRPVPAMPENLPGGLTSTALEKRNNLVNEAFTSQVMIQCPNCSRTFLEDRIEVHMKSCTSENPHKPPPTAGKKQGQNSEVKEYSPKQRVYESKKNENSYEKSLVKPKAFMCHICGREFGTASIEIHLKSCAKLWEEREARKPPNERRQVPEAPVDIPISKTMKNIEQHNAIVSEVYNTTVLIPCPNCSRTFLEDRLQVHLRSCTAEKPHKTPIKPN